MNGRPPKAVLLAAGLGTRLRPMTDRTPKCLIPIGDRPLIDYWAEALIRAGVERALLNTHYLREEVLTHIEALSEQLPLRIVETHEPKLLGSAGTIAANPKWADDTEDVFLIYADNFSEIDLEELLRFHRRHQDPITMALFRAENPSACGIATLDDHGRITAFEEKPDQPTSDLANAGVYALRASAYREIAKQGAFDLGFDVLPRFVGRMRGFPIEGFHLDIGTPANLETARRYIGKGFGKQLYDDD